jgi:class 3 adenylate cyclase/pimeloyl-ACP methyl ester carboxylesterase
MEQQGNSVAIMFTDVVGYTAMMGEDEARTIEVVNQLRSIQKNIIKSHSGVVVKELGDGVMAYFPDGLASVESAVEIQQKVSRVFEAKVRIGIHKAEVVFSEGDIFGDGVNIASRIEPLADPGGIFLSKSVIEDLGENDEVDIKQLGTAKLKNVAKPVMIYAVQAPDLPEASLKRFNQLANPKRKLAVIPTLTVFLIVIASAIFIVSNFNRKRQVAEAEGSLKVIESLVEENWRDFSEAYYLAKEVEKVIPDNEELQEYISRSSVRINITSDPVGADVYVKLYQNPEAEWQYIGITPLDSVEMPVAALRWKMEKEGFFPLEAAALTVQFGDFSSRSQLLVGQDLHRYLQPESLVPSGMVMVPGASMPYGNVPNFYIDQYEVTNQEYAHFLRQGGYKNSQYWSAMKNIMSDSGRWQEVVATLTDSTGNPGPSTWKNGTYPVGQENYPVSGINWYEAAAYANFVGKELPTNDHWSLAQGVNTTIVALYQLGGNAIFAPFSNFHNQHPVEVGSMKGITPFGAQDMGGNVREWCWNETKQGRIIRGGAWNDNPYMFGTPSQADPLDRSIYNGLRCALYPTPKDSIPDIVFDRIATIIGREDTPLPEPVNEVEFARYKDFFEYDDVDLAAIIESSKPNENGWTLETISLNTAYDNERFTAYLFLPENSEPPYQTVIYAGGAGIFLQTSSEDIENYYEFPAFLRFYVKSGRAVLFPVLNGTFERGDGSFQVISNTGSRLFSDFMIRGVKDFRRSLDYLETRNDIDLNRVAFYGLSGGPRFGFRLGAVDTRVKLNIFYAGGLPSGPFRAEVNPAYFLPRITIPTLMINGRFDSNWRLDYEIKNMYELLGTPDKDKRLVLFDSDHLASRKDLVRETLSFLDDYFGPVQLKDAPRLLGSSR